MVELVKALGVEPDIALSCGGPCYSVKFTYQGIRYFGVISTAQLAELDYHLVDGEPVKVQPQTA